jgi:NAD(P)-dependent dehydrogenase (short-subunit alcohol dehydrogenase family)
MSKIIIVGSSGTIGRAVTELLEKDNEVVRFRHSEGDYTVDLGSKESIEKLFKSTGSFDALVCAAGVSRSAKVDEASDDDFMASINNKLMGQINLVRVGLNYITENGSFTITSGLFAREPWPGTVPKAMVNAGLEGFVRAAALDIGKGVRINVVSPVFVTESAKKMGMDTAGTMSAAQTAIAYKISVDGDMSGQVLDVREY